MSEAENKTIARRFNEEVWGRGDQAVLEELLTPTSLITTLFPGRPLAARATSRSSQPSTAPSPT
jgi:hypothetical protein